METDIGNTQGEAHDGGPPQRLTRAQIARRYRERMKASGRTTPSMSAEWRAEEQRRYAASDPWRWFNRNKVANSNRRAREAGVPGSLTIKGWMEKVDTHGRHCHWCDGPYEEIDHIVAMSKGGPNVIDNVVPSCRRCNTIRKLGGTP